MTKVVCKIGVGKTKKNNTYWMKSISETCCHIWGNMSTNGSVYNFLGCYYIRDFFSVKEWRTKQIEEILND